jgi:hypothetical protein
LFGLGNVGGGHSPPHAVIVTEQHADPVELVFEAFLRLDREQRARLAQRLKLRLDGPPKPASLKRPRQPRAGLRHCFATQRVVIT